MQWTFKGQGALWIVAATAPLGIAASSASATGAPDAEAPASPWWTDHQGSEEISNPMLVELAASPGFVFVAWPVPLEGSPLGQWGLSFAELVGPARASMEREASLGASAAMATAGAIAPAMGDGAGAWMLLTVRALYNADPERHQREREKARRPIVRDNDGFEFAPAVTRSLPRRAKELFVGATRQRFDHHLYDFLPSTVDEVLATNPTPGAAALGLIAGACCLGRRRR